MAINDLPERNPDEQASVPVRTDGANRRAALTTLALTLSNGLAVLSKTQTTHRGITPAGFSLELAPTRKGDSLVSVLMSHGSASAPTPTPVLTLSPPSPASGTVGVQSGDFVVTLVNGSADTTVTPADSQVGTFSPSSVLLTAPNDSKTFRLTPLAAASHQVSITNNRGIDNPDPVNYTVSAAVVPTTATLSGSAAATSGVSHTSLVTLDQPADQTYTITWTRSGGGTGPATSTITAGQTSVSAGDTWSSAGAQTVDFTISPSLTRAGRPLNVTVSSASPGVLPSFTIAPGATGTASFAFGHAFRRGDVPAGMVANAASATDWQCSPMTYWDDGSLKHAIIAGRAAVTAGVDLSLAMAAGSAVAGSALTEADLTTALGATSVVVGVDADNTALGSLIGTAALHTTICTGPVMSSWVYRRAVAGNAHLVVWLEVRLFKGGAVEVFPWVENGYLTVASPTNFLKTCSLTIGGVSRFSQVIDIKHHTRIPLINGSSFSYWVGTDPQITPKHDRDYLIRTKLVPNVGQFGPPSESGMNDTTNFPQSYTPNTLAHDDNATGATGGSGNIISPASARYITSSGDARAYRSMMVHGLSSGSWPCHYRDENTQQPAAFATYATQQIGDPGIPAGTGGTNPSDLKISHVPEYAFVPWLVTGRWWFLDELHHWVSWSFLSTDPGYRGNGNGTIWTGSGYQPRGAAWSLNMTAQAAAISPASHPLRAQEIARWESSMSVMAGLYVDGTLTTFGGCPSGNWVSPIGVLGDYNGNGWEAITAYTVAGSNAYWTAAFMQNYLSAVLGYASEIGLAQSAPSQANHVKLRDHSYKLVVGRAGSGQNGEWNWRRFASFDFPYGTDKTGLPVDTYYSTHAQAYSEIVASYGLSALDPAPGGTLRNHPAIGDSDLSGSSREYISTAMAALAMAVDHEATGAREGWERISSASNLSSALSAFQTDDAPHLSVSPRVPEYIASLGTYEVRLLTGSYAPTNGYETLASIEPSEWATSGVGIAGIISEYSGGAKSNDKLHVIGGGHSNCAFNGVASFDPGQAGASKPVGWSLYGLSAFASVPTIPPQAEVYLDGRAPAMHTYDAIFKTASGVIYVVTGGPYGPGGFTKRIWTITSGVEDWTYIGDLDSNANFIGPTTSIYDRATNKAFVVSANPYAWQGRFLRCSNNTLSSYTALSTYLDGEPASAWDPSRGRALYIGQTVARFITIDFVAETASISTVSTLSSLVGRGLSLLYDFRRDIFLAFGGKSGVTDNWTHAYEITPDAATVTDRTLTGSSRTVQSQVFSSGRWCFRPEWRAVIECSSYNQPASVMRI